MNVEKIKPVNLQPFLPGLLLSFIVAAVAKVLALWLPQLGGATLAILLGIVLGNTFFNQKQYAQGTKFAESRLLEYSVVLLGFTVTFQTISEMGIRGFVFIVLMMTIVITAAYLIGKKLGFNQKMSLMMAGGNAVCGSSAIGAIAPAIQADDEERADHHTRQFVRNSDDVDFAVSWSGVVWFGCFTKKRTVGRNATIRRASRSGCQLT